MDLTINDKILDQIEKYNCDDELKIFLKEALRLEFDREKKNTSHFFNEYDDIIEKHVR